MTEKDLVIQGLRSENEALRAELEWKQKEIELARRHEVNWHEVTYRALTSEEKAEYIEHGYADYEIPEYVFDCQMPNDEKPYGWGEFGGYHLCPECYSAWRKLKNQAKSEGEDG